MKGLFQSLLQIAILLLLVSGALAQQFRDDFQRPNEDPLAGSWTAVDGLKLVGGRVEGQGTSAFYGTALFGGSSVLTDQMAQVTIANLSGSGAGRDAQVVLRNDGSNSYHMQCGDLPDPYGSVIWRSGDAGFFFLDNSATQCTTGDKIKGTAVGNPATLNFYKNGALILGPVVDAGQTGGACGIAVEYNVQVAPEEMQLDDFLCAGITTKARSNTIAIVQ